MTKTKRSKYRFTDLKCGEYYVFAVQPYFDQNGKQTLGSSVRVRTYTSLDAVTGIKQSKTTTNSHKLSWKAVEGAEKYKVYYYNESTKKYAELGTTTKTECNVLNLKPTMTYLYKICAIRTASNGKDVRGQISAVFHGYTTPDTVKSVTVQDITSNGCLLEWSAVERAAGYQIFVVDAATGTYQEVATVKGTSCTLRNLPGATKTSCKVRAYAKLAKAVRYGEQSAPVALTTKPTGTTINSAQRQKNGKIRLTWAPLDNCDGYVIYAASDPNGVFSAVAEASVTGTNEAVVTPPAKGDTYLMVRTYVVMNGTRMYSPASDILMVKAAG